MSSSRRLRRRKLPARDANLHREAEELTARGRARVEEIKALLAQRLAGDPSVGATLATLNEANKRDTARLDEIGRALRWPGYGTDG